MFNQKDIIANNIRILNDKDVSVIVNDDDNYLFSALTVEGGGVFKKGLSIGMQEKMIPGLLMYDDENFYGFSEKYGLCLLSAHPEYNELFIPDNVFDNKDERNKLQPVQVNSSEHFQNLKDTEKIENKNLNIDLEIKDSNNFYIIIPENYSNSKFIITFDITYIYDLNSIISNLTLILINKSNKSLFFKIINDNCYYEKDFNNEIEKNTLNRINLEVINNNYFIINKTTFIKK
jgi:hypothetical protein